ncbi:hypothetical protein LCGC14_2080990 [marine sediment metagenome]|uniref:Uncharacterized protein n=1 Tax=marine sediment metagenome TaxID=412755 RepID=A0A0F9HCL0_9ZZZZ
MFSCSNVSRSRTLSLKFPANKVATMNTKQMQHDGVTQPDSVSGRGRAHKNKNKITFTRSQLQPDRR